jgi:hypothetical protein
MRTSSRVNIAVWASFCCLLGFLAVPSGRAQNLYGTIRGTATDQTGAVVAGATVTVTNTGTNISRQAETSATGTFEFLNLLVPATYSVTVEKSGFRKYSNEDIPLSVNQIYVVTAAMEVGQVTQEVTVQASTAQIETSSMQLGATITGASIVDLPLNGRNWVQLQQLQPGVVGSSDRFGGANVAYSTNGAETQQNSYLIDGADSNDLPLNTVGIVPSPDAIGEFRMVTSTMNAEYGRNSGATINAVIKSGTNQFHGDGFEFYRDTFMDARNFFQITTPPFHQNEFGGTVGGPIYKNHAFFFFSYQGIRASEPINAETPTVFSQAQRTGDFSSLPSFYNASNPEKANSPCGAGYTGPFGPNPLPFNIGSATAGTPYCVAFPTGALPTADLNPLAVKLMNQFVPLPNAPGNAYTFNPTEVLTNNQYIWKVDWNIRPQDNAWFYGFYQTAPNTQTLPFTGATLPGFAEQNLQHFQEYTASWNHTFSPTTLNEARFSYFRFNFDAVVPVNPLNPTSYGFTGIIPQFQSVASLPVMSLAGYFTLGFSANGPQPRIDQTYQLVDNFSKVMGRHTLKAGFQMQRFQVYNPFLNNNGGNFTYNGAGTFTTGNPGPDFLLGVPDSYAQGSGNIINARAQEYYSYVQDQWQVKRHLTVTLGLAWDIETPYVNLYDNGEAMMAWRPGQQSTIFPTAPIGFVYPGDAGINKYGGPTTPFSNFGPRVGFAWSPRESTNWVIRGGFGLYYNRTEEELALQGLTNPPFSTTTPGVASVGGSPSFATPFTGWCPGTGGAPPSPCSTAQVFPFAPPAPGSPVNFSAFAPIGFGANTLSPNFGVPTSYNYQISVERQLGPNTVVSVGYVGTQGRHLEGAYNVAYAGTAPGVNPTAAALGCNAFNLASCAPGTWSGIPVSVAGICGTGTLPSCPAIYGGTGQQVTSFNSRYNALQVQFNRHLAHGLQFMAAYTWSRYFDQTSNLENSSFNGPGINPFSLANMWAPSANDAPQRLVFNYFYTLPFYHWAHKWQKLTDGWSLTGITTFQHGLPVGVGDFSYTSLTCDPAAVFYACPDRANATGQALAEGNPRSYTINGNPNYWFSPTAFAVPPAGSGIGNASRNPLYGPGLNNWDMALEKDLHISESKYFQFRLETFNTWNHTQFALPATPGFPIGTNDVSNSTFGRIFGVVTGSTNGGGRVLQLGGKFYF